MRLLLINPRNPLVSMTDRDNRWNRYRVWKPLGLLVLAGITPRDWDVTVIDENVATPDYDRIPRPDLVGVTAFTSQAPRAYELAAEFRRRGIPVVMGGIHATMCPQEAAKRVDSVVTGEAEGIWSRLLADAARGTLASSYAGGHEELESIPLPRHDLLATGYAFGAIQTTRGCPLNCSFCSVSAFNGRSYRRRPIEDVIAEFRTIREKLVLIVDDNLVGTRRDHVARAKDLFRAMIDADLGRKWICQATINMADDDELLALARQAGCIGVFIGFESTTDEGLAEIHKKYNIQRTRNFPASVRRIQRAGITVAGSFIMGLDVDRPGVGEQIARTATQYGVDIVNVLYLTPLPGTELWKSMEADGRIAADRFPEDWKYFTLTLPVGRYRNVCRDEIMDEMDACNRAFYSPWKVLRRVGRNLRRRGHPLLVLVANLSFLNNSRLTRRVGSAFRRSLDRSRSARRIPATGINRHVVAPVAAVPEGATATRMGSALGG